MRLARAGRIAPGFWKDYGSRQLHRTIWDQAGCRGTGSPTCFEGKPGGHVARTRYDLGRSVSPDRVIAAAAWCYSRVYPDLDGGLLPPFRHGVASLSSILAQPTTGPGPEVVRPEQEISASAQDLRAATTTTAPRLAASSKARTLPAPAGRHTLVFGILTMLLDLPGNTRELLQFAPGSHQGGTLNGPSDHDFTTVI